MDWNLVGFICFSLVIASGIITTFVIFQKRNAKRATEAAVTKKQATYDRAVRLRTGK